MTVSGITAIRSSVLQRSTEIARNFFKGRALPGPDDYEQISALAERGRVRTARFFEMLDRHLAGRSFESTSLQRRESANHRFLSGGAGSPPAPERCKKCSTKSRNRKFEIHFPPAESAELEFR